MWLNDLFWGIRNTFLGKYHFLVINDHLWGQGPQCMWTNPSKKSRQGSDLPPHTGNASILGTFVPAFPPLFTVIIVRSVPSSYVWTPYLPSECPYYGLTCVEDLACLLAPVGFRLVGHLISLCPRQHRPAGVHLIEWLDQCLNTSQYLSTPINTSQYLSMPLNTSLHANPIPPDTTWYHSQNNSMLSNIASKSNFEKSQIYPYHDML